MAKCVANQCQYFLWLIRAKLENGLTGNLIKSSYVYEIIQTQLPQNYMLSSKFIGIG